MQVDLNDIAILRYAHAFDTGGGMEQHLHDLDRTLLSRNRMTIVRVYLGRPGGQVERETLASGLGQLVKIRLPLPAHERFESAPPGAAARPSLGAMARGVFRDVLCSAPLWPLVGRRYALSRTTPRRKGEPLGVGTTVAAAIAEFRVSLVMLHYLGGSDSEEVLTAAARAGIPCALQNHFSNERFDHLSVRKQVELADAVAGINALGVPAYLRGRFHNLSNGIDMEGFRAQPSRPAAAGPLGILLPARIVQTKGQLDLVEACRLLKEQGLAFRATMAGRVDSEEFLAELRRKIAEYGLGDCVSLPGVLNQAQLREAYASHEVVAFPTHHDEGLGRVVVEAQAMGLPVVAYDIGGVAEGLLPGQTGFLVKLGDIAGLARGLAELLQDAPLRHRMAQAGRQFVERRFSLPALAERHEQFYRKLLAGAHRARGSRAARDAAPVGEPPSPRG